MRPAPPAPFGFRLGLRGRHRRHRHTTRMSQGVSTWLAAPVRRAARDVVSDHRFAPLAGTSRSRLEVGIVVVGGPDLFAQLGAVEDLEGDRDVDVLGMIDVRRRLQRKADVPWLDGAGGYRHADTIAGDRVATTMRCRAACDERRADSSLPRPDLCRKGRRTGRSSGSGHLRVAGVDGGWNPHGLDLSGRTRRRSLAPCLSSSRISVS